MVVDQQALLEAMGGDWEIVRSVVRTFLRALDAYEGELQQCVQSGDAKAVREVAHKLKGALASLRAPEGRAAAERLEMAAKEGRTQEFSEMTARLVKSMHDVRGYFESPEFVAASE